MGQLEFSDNGFVLLVLLAIALQAPAAPVEPSVYLSFFSEAAQRADTQTSTYAGTLNGQPAGEVTQLSIADSLRITSEQAHSLVQIASLCQGDVNNLDARVRALTFEARIQGVRDDKPSETLEAQLKELEVKRAAIISGYVQQLKASLGDSFPKVDEYVRTHLGSFFVSGPQPKKKL